MALAIDASGPPGIAGALGLDDATCTVTTASFSPPANSLLVALIAQNNNIVANDGTVQSVTNTGTAMSVAWAKQVKKGENANSDGGAGIDGIDSEIWTATCGASPGAITVTITAGVIAVGLKMKVSTVVVVLTDTSTPTVGVKGTGSNASGKPTVTLTGTTAGSYIFAACGDWATAGLGSYTTVDTPLTAVYDAVSGTDYNIHCFRTTSVLATGGTKTMSMNGPAAENYNLAALEIKTVGGAAATTAATFTPHGMPIGA